MLFGLIKAKEGELTIRLPEWMGKEFVEIWAGGFLVGFGSGALAQLIASATKAKGVVADLITITIGGASSYLSYVAANKYPQIRYFMFGGMVVTSFIFLTGFVNLILRALKIKGQMAYPWEGFDLGKYAVMKVFSPFKKITAPTRVSEYRSISEQPKAGGIKLI